MAYNELEKRGRADFPVALFHIDREHTRYNMSAHWHTEVEMIRVLEGSLSLRLNHQPYCAQKGDILFVNSEVVHQGVPTDCIYECIVAHLDFLMNATKSCRTFLEHLSTGRYRITPLLPKDDTLLYCSANCLFDALREMGDGAEFAAIAAFYHFFSVVCSHKHYTPTSQALLHDAPQISKLKNALAYIRQHYNEPVSLGEMAGICGMSPKYFSAFFKRMTGKTPFDYLCAYRLEKASRMLKSTDLNITEVAYNCGFNDLSYFIKRFKQAYGISPGGFKKE